MTELQGMVENKLTQWDAEKVAAAGRAIAAGSTATLVQYPTGLQMMRFAEPYTDFGMHFEVDPETWSDLTSRPEPVFCCTDPYCCNCGGAI